MNVYFLDRDPIKAAEYHVDRHVIKMIEELGQLLSTAHRVLDGGWYKQVMNPTTYRNLCTLGWSGRVDHVARLLPGESIAFSEATGWTVVNRKAMLLDHDGHPWAIWARESIQNYTWLADLFKALCAEKFYRNPKSHDDTMTFYGAFLSNPPNNLKSSRFIEPPLTMPAFYKVDDPVESYRRFYVGDKYQFAKWTNRSIPKWFLTEIPAAWAADPDSRVKFLSDPKLAKKTEITLKHVKKYLPDVYNRLVI